MSACLSDISYDLQAYTMELEAEVQKLKELKAELQKKQVYNYISCCTISVHFLSFDRNEF